MEGYNKKADTTLVGAVAYVEPSATVDSDSTLHFEIWTVKSHEVQKLTVNNSLEKWRLESNQDRVSFGMTNPRKRNGNISSVELGPRQDIYSNGQRLFSNTAGMAIYQKGELLLAVPSVDPRMWRIIDRTQSLSQEIARTFFRPVLDEHLERITDRPKHQTDVNFWQYPCQTEKQALLNHLAIREPSIDRNKRIISIYVPLPWATYIDNKEFPADFIRSLSQRVAFLKVLAGCLGYVLQAHTVCQHIRWRNMLEAAEALGITDVSISHCTAEARVKVATSGSNLRLHPWTLYAVNYCDPTRRGGLVVGKPMRDRKYLASFIGAHMSHYLSDIRLRLFEGLSALDADDILMDLGDLWHFNDAVYEHQVKSKHTGDTIPVGLENETFRYNQVLSDSRFSLCPEGAGPNTLRLWESIAVGAVPVLFSRSLEFPLSLKRELDDLCVFWEDTDYSERLQSWLRAFSVEDLDRRSQRLREIFSRASELTCF